MQCQKKLSQCIHISERQNIRMGKNVGLIGIYVGLMGKHEGLMGKNMYWLKQGDMSGTAGFESLAA